MCSIRFLAIGLLFIFPTAGQAQPSASPATLPDVEWGAPIHGLRAGWRHSSAPVRAGDRPIVSMEVQNVSDQPIIWGCVPEITLHIADPFEPLSAACPHFTVSTASGARLATGEEVRGQSSPNIGPKDPFPPFYYLPARGRVIMTAKYLWVIAKPGIATVNGSAAYVAFGNAMGRELLHCPPLVLNVEAGDPSAANAYDVVWSAPVDGFQVGITYRYGRSLLETSEVAGFDIVARNLGNTPITFTLSQTNDSKAAPTIRDPRGNVQQLQVLPVLHEYPLLHWTLEVHRQLKVPNSLGFRVVSKGSTTEDREVSTLFADPGDYTVTSVFRYNTDGGDVLSKQILVGPIGVRIAAAKP